MGSCFELGYHAHMEAMDCEHKKRADAGCLRKDFYRRYGTGTSSVY